MQQLCHTDEGSNKLSMPKKHMAEAAVGVAAELAKQGGLVQTALRQKLYYASTHHGSGQVGAGDDGRRSRRRHRSRDDSRDCRPNSQCLNRRLDTQSLTATEVTAWEKKRNLAKARIH